MHVGDVAPDSPDCRGAGSFPVRCVPRSGRRSLGSNDPQCPGGDVAGDRRTRTTPEPRPGQARAQGVAAQVSDGGHRLDADPLPWPAGSRSQRDLSWRTEVGHDPFPCLRHGGGCPQGLPLHLGPHPGGIRRFHERGGPATVGDCRPQGGQSPFSPAGQGVFQRGGDPLSAPRRSWIHHSRRCAR